MRLREMQGAGESELWGPDCILGSPKGKRKIWTQANSNFLKTPCSITIFIT